ncbi:MAG: NAD(P)H-hydrate epimerase [Nitrososphaerota archaeon]|nr:NAD(P)H-hydrate epimerase [Nitrososphaerota archaeon]MDG7052056.1 NAD(P)H-hydrate epimerase [Nitrososphaerota archaeon]
MSISTEEMKDVEHAAEALGLSSTMMMENAGRAVAQVVLERFDRGTSVGVVCGMGNNGGDGLAAARHLRLLGYDDVSLFIIGERGQLKTQNVRLMLSLYEKLAPVVWLPAPGFDLGRFSVILDSIFGTGMRGYVKEPHRSVIESINRSSAYIIAVDVPSGVNSDDGTAADPSVLADLTVTFHRAKNGLLKNRLNVGILRVEEIGIPL